LEASHGCIPTVTFMVGEEAQLLLVGWSPNCVVEVVVLSAAPVNLSCQRRLFLDAFDYFSVLWTLSVFSLQ
jgi:hypothetical protein